MNEQTNKQTNPANTNAPVIMIAERAADFIRFGGDHFGLSDGWEEGEGDEELGEAIYEGDEYFNEATDDISGEILAPTGTTRQQYEQNHHRQQQQHHISPQDLLESQIHNSIQYNNNNNYYGPAYYNGSIDCVNQSIACT